MNKSVAVRKCNEYNQDVVFDLISDIYKSCEGPDVMGKKVLVKPNILTDTDPLKCVSTHPVIVEAMVKYLISGGAKVFVGDSPAIHKRGFKGVKSGIEDVCMKTGAEWVDFTKSPVEKTVGNSRIKVASIVDETDLIISLPKLKNHELVYFTGAIKNTFGLVPGFSKARQHALYQNRSNFSFFLVDLNEAITPHFILMDGIMGMEGPGPGHGIPVKTGVLLGSSNPLALDIIASSIAGYNPLDIPTSAIALKRGEWLKSPDDIILNGPDLKHLIKRDFIRIPVEGDGNIALKFLKNRFRFIRKFERRPVFIHNKCTGCKECIRICPANAILMHPDKKNHVVLTDSKCIRCFCCSEVCQYDAIDIRRKIFGE